MYNVAGLNERLLFPYKSENHKQDFYEKMHLVNSRIVDEQSRTIFRYRLLMSLTGDIEYIRKLVLSTATGKDFFQFLKNKEGIFVYGAGIRGERIVQMFPEISWRGYIDRKRSGTCNGIPIVSLGDVKLQDEDIILISNLEGFDGIKKDLIEEGIEEERIYTLDEFEVAAHKKQYFEERCIKYFKVSDGAFVDAGCFDGNDCIKYTESMLYQGAPIYAFEPDIANFENCKRGLQKYKNATVFNVGLSNIKKQVNFTSNKGECSRIDEKGNCIIDIDTIDSVLEGKKIGCFKLDIEGNEKEAIEGARIHIEQDRPNMMISIYHKLEDIIEIPRLLLELNPNYRFAFGHYSIYGADTVLYVFE